MKRVLKSTVCLLLVLGLSQCSRGTNTGNGRVRIRMGLSTSLQALTSAAGEDAQGTRFSVTSARGNVRNIILSLPDGQSCNGLDRTALEAPVSCDGDKILVTGPFVVDLMAQTATPTLENLTIPALTYKRADVRFEEAEPQDGVVAEGDPLAHNTLLAGGTFPYQLQTMTFQLALKFSEDAVFENEQGIALVEGVSADLLLGLDVAQWFSAIPITQCLGDGDLQLQGTELNIQDDQGSCSDIESAIKLAIKNSGRLAGE